MFYFPLNFGELTLGSLVDTGALSRAIPEAELRKVQFLAPQAFVKEGGIKLPDNGSEWLAENSKEHCRIEIRGQGHRVPRDLHCHGKTHKPSDWPLLPSTQHYHLGYATRSAQFSVLLNATQKN